MTTITERPPAPIRVALGALLLGLCVAFLPTWDGLSYYEMMRTLEGAGLATGVRASAGFAKIVIAVGVGVSIARALAGGKLSVRRRANRSPRRLIFALGVLVTLAYLVVTAVMVTLPRERMLHASLGVLLGLVLSGLLLVAPRRSLVKSH